MAAPHVAGAVALLHAGASEAFAQYYENSPSMASLVMKNIIMASTDSLDTLQGITVSGGRLNVHSAMLAMMDWNGSPGDLNDDSLLNVQDLVILVNILLDVIEPTPQQLIRADLNYDEFIIHLQLNSIQLLRTNILPCPNNTKNYTILKRFRRFTYLCGFDCALHHIRSATSG